jgi:flagellin
MRIRNNISSINSTRNQGINQGNMAKSLEKLSTGYKINRAGDNAAGLALSEGMRRQIYGLKQAMGNVKDGIGLVNTGEGALTEVHSMLQRLNTLAVQAANGTYNSTARSNIISETDELLNEIDRIAESCNFNDIDLFKKGSLGNPPPELHSEIPLQIGCSAEETLTAKRYYMGSEALQLDDIDLTGVKEANEALPKIKKAVEAVSLIRSDFGSVYTHLKHTYSSISITRENMQASESAIRDTSMCDEFTNYTRDNILLQSAQAMMVQANAMSNNVLSLLQ